MFPSTQLLTFAILKLLLQSVPSTTSSRIPPYQIRHLAEATEAPTPGIQISDPIVRIPTPSPTPLPTPVTPSPTFAPTPYLTLRPTEKAATDAPTLTVRNLDEAACMIRWGTIRSHIWIDT